MKKYNFTDDQILKAIEECNGIKRQAANLLGIPWTSFRDYLRRITKDPITPKNKNISEESLLASYKEAGNIKLAAEILGVTEGTYRKHFSNLKVNKNFDVSDASSQFYKAENPYTFDPRLPESTLDLKPFLRKGVKRIVITTALNNTPVHNSFFNTLLSYCQHNDAHLGIIASRYKNVTAYSSKEEYDIYWDDKIVPHHLKDDVVLTDHLYVMGGLKVGATAVNPLSGVLPALPGTSAIIGHPQIQMNMVAMHKSKYPRQLLTTGCCTLANYSSSKAGYVGNFNHSYGATVIEVIDGIFFTRQINASKDGSFYDVDKLYLPNGDVIEGQKLEALVCGDIHAWFSDPDAIAGTFTNEDSMMKVCKPNKTIVHDVLDFRSRNHHDINKDVLNYLKSNHDYDNVKRELDDLVDFHNDIISSIDDTEIYYVASNHHDHLNQWLESTDIRKDPKNAWIYHKLKLALLEGSYFNQETMKFYTPNPMSYYMSDKIKNSDKTYFIGPNEELEVKGVDLSQHGHIGLNGARSAKSLGKSGSKIVSAHTHSPFIDKGHYGVGTLSRLDLGYNQGYSSWMHTNCFIYPNGKRSLVSLIDGIWRI